jgi:L-asparaginase
VQEQQIVVLGTGGTIAGRAQRAGGELDYRAGEIGVEQLLQGLPALEGVAVVAEQLAQIDSKDMAFELWRELAARCRHWIVQPQVQGIVITHGTDTLEETAWFLERVLAPRKPIVLVSAMRPATALSPDGPQNLAEAFTVVRSAGASGVLAVCAGAVHGAADVRKVHPYRVAAFSSGDAGALAYVEAGAVRQLRAWTSPTPSRDLFEQVQRTAQWPWVEIVHSHAGADGRVVDALAAAGVKGLVVAGTGNGSVHAALEQALLRAQGAGVRVVRSSRCLEGPVIPLAKEALPCTPLTPAKARVDLLLDLLA